MKSTFTFFIFLFFIFGVSQELLAAKCTEGTSKKVIGGKDLIADRCPRSPSDQSLSTAQKYCNGNGWSFFGLDGGGFGCSTQYKNYQDFCQKNFSVDTKSIKHSSGYTTISPEDMQRCIAGNAAAPTPVASEKCADGDSVESGCNCDESVGFKVDGYYCRKIVAGASASGDQSKCVQKVANYSTDNDGKCFCGGENSDLYEEKNGACAKKSDTAGASSKTATASDCDELKAYEAKAESCKTDGTEAIKKCDSNNTDSNKTYGDMQDAIRLFSQVSMMKGKQEGSAQACFDAGMVGTAGYQALDLLKDSCTDGVSKCESACSNGLEGFQDMFLKCDAKFAQANPTATSDQRTENAGIINERGQTARKKFETGIKSCKVDAKSAQDRAAQMMKEMNQTAQQATKCQCQLTAGQTNCDQVQGPEYCAANPTDTQKCPITYDIKNPIKPTTSSVAATKPGGSELAGPGYAPVNSGNVNFKPGAAGGGVGDLGDLSSGSSGASGDATQGGGVNPFAAAGGGGGGGSGGGTGGSDGNGAATGAEPEAKTGVGGLFNNLKTGLANMLGGGSGKNSGSGKNYGTKGGANGKDVDPNAWKPRTLAGGGSGSGIGGKNMDIFKMINTQYDNQYHTLMTAPEAAPK